MTYVGWLFRNGLLGMFVVGWWLVVEGRGCFVFRNFLENDEVSRCAGITKVCYS